MVFQAKKKNPDLVRDTGFPFLPRDLIASIVAAKWSPDVRTGLLTCGSSYQPRLPI